MEGFFCHFHKLAKSRFVRSGQMGQQLAVHFDFGGPQSFHESAVTQAGRAGRRVDANLPKSAKRAFFVLPISIGVLTPMIQGVGGIPIKFGTAKSKALGGTQCPPPSPSRSGRIGYSHVLCLLGFCGARFFSDATAKRQIEKNATLVGRIQHGGGSQAPPPFWILAAQQVPLAGAIADHFPGRRNFETFGNRLPCFLVSSASHNLPFPSKEHQT